MTRDQLEILLFGSICLTGLYALIKHHRLPSPAPMHPFPGDLYTFGRCALWVLGTVFFAVIGASALVQGQPALTATLGATYAQHGGAILALFFVSRFILLRDPAPQVNTLTPKPIARKHILPAALLAYCVALPVTVIATLLWAKLLETLDIHAPQQDMLDFIRQAQSPGQLILLLILPIILAPVSEELIFRGGIYRILMRYSTRWVALLLSSAFFSIIHGYTYTFVPLLVLGLFLSFAYERTGRIAVPILVHGLFNLSSVLQLFFGSAP